MCDRVSKLTILTDIIDTNSVSFKLQKTVQIFREKQRRLCKSTQKPTAFMTVHWLRINWDSPRQNNNFLWNPGECILETTLSKIATFIKKYKAFFQ